MDARGEGKGSTAAWYAASADAKLIALMLMEDHWRADSLAWMQWDTFLAQQMPGPWLQAVVIAHRSWDPRLRQQMPGAPRGALVPRMTWRYRKLGLLVAHMEASCSERGSASGLAAVEDFARSAPEQWLKVAGGAKGKVLDDAARGCPASCYGGGGYARGTMALEFGTFVGYSSSRLAVHSLVLSFEQDPVHACIAQHLLDLAAPPGTVEVWLGRVSDVTARVAEARGAGAVGLAFLDESGASFQPDLARLAAATLPAAAARVAADNCLRPGAPRLLAHWGLRATSLPPAGLLTSWSVPEFLEEAEGVEDWLALISPQPADA